MKLRTPIAAVALVSLALAGCGDAGSTTAGASGGPSVTATTAAAPTGSATSTTATRGAGGSASPGTGDQSVGDTLLVFTRQGGMAGTNDKLVVKPDGAWTLQTKAGTKSGKLTSTELTTLKSALDQVGFSKVPKVNDNPNIADGYKYTIIYSGNEVSAQDGAVPPQLQPVFATLNALIATK